MEIWLDTIDLELVDKAAKCGIISGVTTNPTILSKAAQVKHTLTELLNLQQGPVAVQVTAHDKEGMIQEGRKISQFSNRMLVKIPVNTNGLTAIHHLSQEQVPILGTAIFHPTQALLAARHGIAYIAPYFSHIKAPANAHEVLQTMLTILKSNNYRTKLMVASLKTLEDFLYCAQIGVHAVTIKQALYEQLIADHHLLENISNQFQSDWQQSHGKSSIADLL